MRFHEAAEFLLDLRRFRMSPGVASTGDLLAHLGDPHESLSAVQVAGSNGKGSTARMLESVLREAGLTVGLFTSPHLDDLRERVRVDGRPIPERSVAAFVDAARDHVVAQAAEGEGTTFFEAMTAMALWHFDAQDVDVAVLEVGIGGRHDATSVVDPVASAVTSVTTEHTDVLGDTIAEIATDKAAVAPRDAPLVTGTSGEALDVVRETAGDVLVVGDGEDADVTATYGGRRGHAESAVSVRGDGWAVDARVPLLGSAQARNAGVAAALARQVADVDVDTLATGLRRAHWPGRFEVTETDPLVVLDGAHNPGACTALAETLAEFEYDDLHLVVGAMHDKDHRGMAAGLPTADRVVACEPDLDRAADPEVLARVFAADGADRVDVVPAVETALADALDGAGPDDCVLVTGSLFTVGEARRRWTRPAVPSTAADVSEARAAFERVGVTADEAARAAPGSVHRTLRTRLQPRQAHRVAAAFRDAGGECAVSALADQGVENVDVVLSGSVASFRRLFADLDSEPYGLPAVAADLRAALDRSLGNGDAGPYPWSDGTAVMGILNVTPDSFHDGGEYDAHDDAVARAEAMVANGADVVDVGGESTRPGAEPVPAEVERERVVPVIERIADLDAMVSVDTRKADVAAAALDAGADVVNDVSGLADPEMRFVVADRDAPIVVMHSIETPVDPETHVDYDDVVDDVLADLQESIRRVEQAGLPREKILVDPGVGFGKSAAESFELLDRVDEFRALGCPVLVGHSHKSLFEAVDRGPDERGAATVAGTALAAERGADVVRVHDVAENVAAVRTVEAARRGTDD